MCLAGGADPDAVDRGVTALLACVHHYHDLPVLTDLTVLQLLIPDEPGAARDARLSARGDKARTALHHAVGNPPVLEFLLSLLSDGTRELLHAADEDGWEPLHTACHEHCTASMELLLAAGAELR